METMTQLRQEQQVQQEQLEYMELGGVAMRELFAEARANLYQTLGTSDADQVMAAQRDLWASRETGVDLMFMSNAQRAAYAKTQEGRDRATALQVSNEGWDRVAAAATLEQAQQRELENQFRIFTSSSSENEPSYTGARKDPKNAKKSNK